MKRKALLLLTIVFVTITTSAQTEKIKTAYIYQFLRFIEWCPEFKTGDFVIAVLGDSPIYDELLKTSKGKKIGIQNIVVKKYTSQDEIVKTNILVLPSGRSSQLSSVLLRIGSNCTLVISEKAGHYRDGAAISFIEEGGKLLFELNKSSFTNRSLGVNAQLQTLAKTVI